MSTKVSESCNAWTPAPWLRPLVDELLRVVEPRLLAGLTMVRLTNTAGLPRTRRRAKTWARGRKVAVTQCRGLYHAPRDGQGALVELLADRMLDGLPRGIGWIPVVREIVVGGTLYHELGHHIHATQQPEFRDREAVAEDWRKRLQREAFRARHPWLAATLRPLGPLLRHLVDAPNSARATGGRGTPLRDRRSPAAPDVDQDRHCRGGPMRPRLSILTVLLIAGCASGPSSSSRIDAGPPAAGGYYKVRPAAPDESARDEAFRSSREFRYSYYFSQIKRGIAVQWNPADVIKRTPDSVSQESVTELSLVIGQDGRLETAEVTRSSGVPSLDAEALRAVRAASPFAVPPAGVLDADGKLHFPFGFKVSTGGQEHTPREPRKRTS